MPSRNQSMIRRDINRLHETVKMHRDSEKTLLAIEPYVSEAAENVNNAWKKFQMLSVEGDKERAERETAIEALLVSIQSWRPVIMLTIPGAHANLKKIPATGTTPDDLIRMAEDMIDLIQDNPAAGDYAEDAVADLKEKSEIAKMETTEATFALPAENSARDEFSEACVHANTVLIRGTEIVRALFGRTSPEYKKFIARSKAGNDDEEAASLAEAN